MAMIVDSSFGKSQLHDTWRLRLAPIRGTKSPTSNNMTDPFRLTRSTTEGDRGLQARLARE